MDATSFRTCFLGVARVGWTPAFSARGSVGGDARAKDSLSLLSEPLQSPPFGPLFMFWGPLEEAAEEVGKEFKKCKLTDPLEPGPVWSCKEPMAEVVEVGPLGLSH